MSQEKDLSRSKDKIASAPFALFSSPFTNKEFFDVNIDPMADGFDPLYINPHIPVPCGLCPLALIGLLGREELFEECIKMIPKEKLRELNGSDLANQIYYWCAMGGNENNIITWTTVVDVCTDFEWGLIYQGQPRSVREALAIYKPDLLTYLDEESNMKAQMELFTNTNDSNRMNKSIFASMLRAKGIPVTSSFKIPKSNVANALDVIKNYLNKSRSHKNF